MDPVTALAQLGGVASSRALLDRTTRWALRRALAAGTVVRVRRDRYALASIDEAARLAVAAGGVLAGPSAAVGHGWKVMWAPRRPWVVVPAHARRPDPGLDLEVRWGDLDAPDVEGVMTTRARTVADCARWLPFPEALSVADSALRSGTGRAALRAAVERLPRNGRSRAAVVVDRADGRADNPFESAVRAVAHDVPGLRLVPQVRVEGVGRVDLADRSLRIAVECDSYAFHTDPEAFALDLRRHTALVRQGWRLVRVGWEDAMRRPAQVRATLVDVVALATASEAHPCPRCSAA